jgi:hypothetical protein
MADARTVPNASHRKHTRKRHPSTLRAITDELGVTTPKPVARRRKGPMRVAVYRANKGNS